MAHRGPVGLPSASARFLGVWGIASYDIKHVFGVARSLAMPNTPRNRTKASGRPLVALGCAVQW